jgi:hypothetical protein
MPETGEEMSCKCGHKMIEHLWDASNIANKVQGCEKCKCKQYRESCQKRDNLTKGCGKEAIFDPYGKKEYHQCGINWTCPSCQKQESKPLGCGKKTISGIYRGGGYWHLYCGDLGRLCKSCQKQEKSK